MTTSAKKVQQTTATETATETPRGGRREHALHEAVLSPEDYTFLASLPEQRAGDRRRSDMALLLADEDTRQALVHYADFFAFAGVDVAPAVEAIPRLVALQRLVRRLELAQELVRRHLNAEGERVSTVASDVHRLLVATPEGSSVRTAFAAFDDRWRETFRGGNRASHTEDSPVDPSGPTK